MFNVFINGKFGKPEKAAELFSSVRVLVKKCPELEARLSLLIPPKKPKRRISSFIESNRQPKNNKRRRHSTYVPGTSQINGNDIYDISPLFEAPEDNSDSMEGFIAPINVSTNIEFNEVFPTDIDHDTSFEELIYHSSSDEETAQLNDVRNMDRQHLADSISLGIEKMSQILARRHSIDSYSKGNACC